MIGLLIQDNAYEQDIRELLMSFYPGEAYVHEVKDGADFYVETRLGDGEVVHTSFSSAQRDGRLEVTLQDECTEEIGRFVPLESITEENEAEP